VEKLGDHVDAFLRNRRRTNLDSKKTGAGTSKGLIPSQRRPEDPEVREMCGVRDEQFAFLDLRFIKTGAVRKSPCRNQISRYDGIVASECQNRISIFTQRLICRTRTGDTDVFVSDSAILFAMPRRPVVRNLGGLGFTGVGQEWAATSNRKWR